MRTRRIEPHFNRHNRCHRRSGNIYVVLIVVVVAIGLSLWGLSSAGLIGADKSAALTAKAMTHIVKREQLVVTVTEDGTLESAKNVDLKCEVAGGSLILKIEPDGTEVVAGQVLVQLDSSGLEEQLRSQKGIYEKALAAKIQADEDAGAAEIGVEEYSEGLFKKSMQDCEATIKIALENMRSSENILEHSKRMSRKGFVTPLQVEADQFAVERARLELDSANTSKAVLEKYTRAKTLKELEGKRDAAKARARSEAATVELEKGKLDKLTAQLTKCVIHAPSAGMVVYYKESSRWGSSSSVIQEGAAVRENQTIIQLPTLTEMQARVPINESKVELVKRGMRAHLKVLDKDYQGTVMMIANQPESKSMFQSQQVKDYPAVIRIDGDATGLRPGYTAEIEILIDDLKDVLTVPVGAIVEQNGQHKCWVQKPTGPEERSVLLGKTNDKFVEVKDGVVEGEAVILNPRAIVPASRTDNKTDKKDDVDTKKKFGEAKPLPAGSPKPATGGSPAGPMKVADYDKDGDGKMSKAEAPENVQAFFDRMDENKDGFITQAEATASYRRMLERRKAAEGGGAGGPPGGPPGGM